MASVGEGEGEMIWENGTEICIIYMKQVASPGSMHDTGALGRPRGMVWGERMEEGSGWGTCVYLWWIHVATNMHTHPLDPMCAVWLISLKMLDVVTG